MEEKYQKQLLVKREQLLKQLQEEGCLANRVMPGGEVGTINMEQAEKCHSLREEMEKIDKELNVTKWTNEPKHETEWKNEEKH